MKAGAWFTGIGSGAALALEGRLFKKEIIPADTDYVHPVTKEKLRWPLAEVKQIAATTNEFKASQKNRIPFPDGHRFDAMNNLGHWPGEFSVEPGSEGKMWLKGVCEPANDEIADRLADGRIKDVSAFIESRAKDSHGKEYSNVITHVCATNYPVVHSKPFEALPLSRDGAPVGIYLSTIIPTGGTKTMSKKMARLKLAFKIKPEEPDGDDKALAALGLSDDDSDDAYSAKLGRVKAALAGIDFPHEETKKLAQEKGDAEKRAGEAETRNLALATQNADMSKRLAGLEFDKMLAGFEREAPGIPLGKDNEDWARACFLSGRPEDAKRVLGLAATVAKSTASGAGKEVDRPGQVTELSVRKERLEGAMKIASSAGGNYEKRADGLAYRPAGGQAWIEF